METMLLRPQLPNGPAFVREMHGTALVLNPRSPLQNLREEEIAQETLELLEMINHGGPTHLIIDLQNGDYFGTVVLGAVVRLWKRVAQRGGRLMLCNVSATVVQILRVTKLHAAWSICGSREDALRAVGM